MWQCPKCKCEFRNTNQDHYCKEPGEQGRRDLESLHVSSNDPSAGFAKRNFRGKIETIDQYIFEQAKEVQPILQKIREVIHAAAPKATEKISWQMPTFWQSENVIHFATFKKHVSIFPGGDASTVFADKLTDYKTAKGTIQFPLNKPIPYEIIDEITRWRVSCVEDKNKPNTKIYKYDSAIQAADEDKDTAYIVFPYDIKTEFGKGRVKVHATFDGEPYDGSIVNMGVKNADGSVCYIVGIRKDIRAKIGRQIGDIVAVTIQERG